LQKLQKIKIQIFGFREKFMPGPGVLLPALLRRINDMNTDLAGNPLAFIGAAVPGICLPGKVEKLFSEQSIME